MGRSGRRDEPACFLSVVERDSRGAPAGVDQRPTKKCALSVHTAGLSSAPPSRGSGQRAADEASLCTAKQRRETPRGGHKEAPTAPAASSSKAAGCGRARNGQKRRRFGHTPFSPRCTCVEKFESSGLRTSSNPWSTIDALNCPVWRSTNCSTKRVVRTQRRQIGWWVRGSDGQTIGLSGGRWVRRSMGRLVGRSVVAALGDASEGMRRIAEP